MKYVLFLFSFFLVCSLPAQEYKTYKKVNDSTFVETRSYEVEEETELSEGAVLRALFREIDRWANIESRHYLNSLAAQRVFVALRRDQESLVPDTNYIQYNQFRDTIYSHPELKRDESNQIVYDSEILIGDTTYNAQLFRNAGGAQVLRIEDPAGNYAARFIASDKEIRVGINEPLPGLSDYCDLRYINENPGFIVYFGIIENKVVRLKIRKR